MIAFKQVNWNKGILASPWVGFSNFEYLFTTKEAWVITRNTLGYNLVFIVLGTIIAIAVAILLNEIRSMTLKKTYQTVILLPYLISMVVVSYLVYALLSSENGFINLSILEPLGLNHRQLVHRAEILAGNPHHHLYLEVFRLQLHPLLRDAGRHRPRLLRSGGHRRRKPLAAGLEYHPAGAGPDHHHPDADEHRQDLLLRLRPLLPGPDGFRPPLRRHQHDRHLRLPRP